MIEADVPASPPARPAFAGLIPAPSTVAETGLTPGLLADLLVKTMYYQVRITSIELAELVRLARPVVDEILQRLREDALVEVLGPASALNYYYALTARGRARADEAFERSRYVGPAPVPFHEYVVVQSQQAVRALTVAPSDVRAHLSQMVLRDRVIESIGAAVLSTGSILLYGPSGNGKSTIASHLRAMLPGYAAVPHALEMGGQIVKVFDGRVHQRVSRTVMAGLTASSGGFAPLPLDARYAICRRPLVTLGSELMLSDLELVYSSADGAYGAPPQLRAAGGVLVIDDLGRQLVTPEELLNRWIGPMGSGWDQMVLRSGETVQVPFDVLLVFATNLDPRALGDEAFERRIRHKVLVPSPTLDEFMEILWREASAQGIAYDEQVAQRFVDDFYIQSGRPLRASHPGDLLRNLNDFARFRGEPPSFDFEHLRAAAEAFFVVGSIS